MSIYRRSVGFQVVHDGEQYRPVIGGFNSGPIAKRGFYETQFNMIGEYKFVRCVTLVVCVIRESLSA